jgi:hypothetical protein
MTQEQFSIIVPQLGTTGQFEDTLASVLRTRPDSTQVVVVHGQGYQDPHGLSGEVEFYDAGRSPNLSQLWNAALAQARGQWVVWLHPGIELNDGWDFDLADEFSDKHIACLLPPIFGVQSARAAKQKRRACFGMLWDSKHPVAPITQETDIPQAESQTSDHSASQPLLLPSPLIGIFRNNALGWLEPLDAEQPDLAWSSEIGLSLNRLGFQVAISQNMFATSEISESLIFELQSQAQLPQAGTVFERAVSRFFPELVGGRRRRSYQHVLRQLWQPTAWRFAGESLRAEKFAAVDHAFHERLLLARQRREKLAPWAAAQPAKTPETTLPSAWQKRRAA